MDIVQKIQEKLQTNETDERRRKYFLWKHKINTTLTDYANMTQEEFTDWACDNDNQFNYLIKWEKSKLYKELTYTFYKSRFDDDILEVYDAVKNDAKTGNTTSAKTMISLQKEISKRLKNFNVEEEKGNDLTLDI